MFTGRTIPPEAFVSPSNKFRAFLAQRKKETSCWRKVVKEEDNLKVRFRRIARFQKSMTI